MLGNLSTTKDTRNKIQKESQRTCKIGSAQKVKLLQMGSLPLPNQGQNRIR